VAVVVVAVRESKRMNEIVCAGRLKALMEESFRGFETDSFASLRAGSSSMHRLTLFRANGATASDLR